MVLVAMHNEYSQELNITGAQQATVARLMSQGWLVRDIVGHEVFLEKLGYGLFVTVDGATRYVS